MATSKATSKNSSATSWLLEVKSTTMKRWAWGSAAVVLAVHIFMGAVVDVGDTGAAVTTIDKLAFPILGLVLASLCLLMLRPRLRANAKGVEVRNFLNPRFYSWNDIYGLSFPREAKWARLELPEFEFVPVWAIQSADKEAAVKAMKEFRKLEDSYMPVD